MSEPSPTGDAPPDRLEAVMIELREFVAEREWHRFHDPKNLAMAVASEAGELLAELRWVPNGDADRVCQEPARRQRIADEVADVAITLLMLADRMQLDLPEAIRAKMLKNQAKYPAEECRGRSEI